MLSDYPISRFLFDLIQTFNLALPYVLAGGFVIGVLNWVVGAALSVFKENRLS